MAHKVAKLAGPGGVPPLTPEQLDQAKTLLAEKDGRRPFFSRVVLKKAKTTKKKKGAAK